MAPYRIKSLTIQGYRPFGNFHAELGSLEVIAGANGSGKSSLFEFLRFLRNASLHEIPPEIVPGTEGQQIFHRPGPDRFSWTVRVDTGQEVGLNFAGELMGPIGATKVTWEKVVLEKPLGEQFSRPLVLLDVRGSKGKIYDRQAKGLAPPEASLEEAVELKRPNQLMLGTNIPVKFTTLYQLREFIQSWKFYCAFNIDQNKIREAAFTEERPVLREDASNLAAVLNFFQAEYPTVFEEVQTHLRGVVPGFKDFRVKPRGGPGRVMVFWREEGIRDDLTLADVSDGSLRLLCWITLCLAPNIPPLLCIDEPDQGVHPRTLPKLAGLFEKTAQRSQVLLATHASYFLMQFKIPRLAVMRKENGEAKFLKPADSKVFKANLEDFGVEEIELMHRNDELERLI